jgi:hypothetical protein
MTLTHAQAAQILEDLAANHLDFIDFCEWKPSAVDALIAAVSAAETE